jgi:hypothetical protein
MHDRRGARAMLTSREDTMTDTAPRFDEARRMLALAALSYRGFQSGLTPRLQSERLHGAVERGLGNLTPIARGYELVWGPIAYRAPLSLVDDVLMYVVRGTSDPHEYVVVVRGTNPVSPFDWLLGDFWVGVQAPWDHAADPSVRDAKISFSTLLGLNMLQTMQAPPPPMSLIGSLGQCVLGRLGDATDQLRAWLRPLGDGTAARLTTLRSEVLPMLAALDDLRRARGATDPTAAIRGPLEAWRSAKRRATLRAIGDAIALVGDDQSFNALRFLTGGERLRASLVPGVTLIAFFSAAVAAADGAPVRITVTGHSKGGALASTLALWLADTQGDSASEPAVAWDPQRRAIIRCVAFAGPTAGNAAFAAHSDHVIGDDCRRVVNPLDVAPCAWDVATLRTIPTLYRDALPTGLVGDLVGEIAAEGERLRYAHVGRRVTQIMTHEDPLYRNFFVQAGHQHLAVYLQAFGLGGEFADVLTFFNPLA